MKRWTIWARRASKTAYITVGDPTANIYTPAVRIEIEGVDVTDRRIPRDGLDRRQIARLSGASHLPEQWNQFQPRQRRWRLRLQQSQ